MNGVIDQVVTDRYALYNGDSTDVMKNFPDNSIDLSVYSVPFNSLYTYSNSDRDLGNCKSPEEFYDHLGYIVAEIFRTTKPGRISACHCMNIPAMKERDGYIGLKDFRGDLIRLFQKHGFIFHSEHCIWKDPLLEAVRTKALGLMHKQLCKDSTMSRAGIPDYLLGFRKPGGNDEVVSHPEGLTEFYGENEPADDVGDMDNDSQWGAIAREINPPKKKILPHERWRRYASPVWMDIKMTNTLQYMSARSSEDEKHICPLSLDVSRRAIQLWSNPGETVLTPFMGIGSEVYSAVELGRMGLGIELKESYFRQAIKNIKTLDGPSQLDLFA